MSSTVPSPSASQEPVVIQAGQLHIVYYFIPVGVVLGAMFGASVTVVLTRRCGKRGTDQYSHPYPAEGGGTQYDDTRDEQEKQWIENRRSYSEDEYETGSDAALSPKPEVLPQISAPTSYGSLRFSRQQQVPRKHEVPISESFYDDAMAEGKALELNLSSDEEPPTPYARLESGSIRRILLQNIDLEVSQSRNPTVQSQSTLLNELARTNHPNIGSPVNLALSPHQMRDLFFIDHEDEPRNQWVTAQRLLGDQHAEDEDSDEEDTVKRAVLLAGISGDSERGPLVQSKGVPNSLSTLSTIVVPRRLVKPRWRTSSQAERGLFIGEQEEEVEEQESNDAETPHVPSGYHRIGDIVNLGWSQRDISSARMSPTGFGSSLSVYDDQSILEGPDQGRTVTFRPTGDGIEHRLGFFS